ncbi:MAG: cupin domain-containing protein [Allosphingosinicella sp.]|uniref:cupin domain-containing protein n=1 Tax=Allosphingosinicella sp. TaxID=2823234 RepID=UPI0039482F0C
MIAVQAATVPPRPTRSRYPEPFAALMAGRTKRVLGELFGLTNFGVNLTTLEPGARSALHHRHSAQDEFVYVLDGEAVIIRGSEEVIAGPGTCAGFKAGGDAHHIENRGQRPVTYLEIGDRTRPDRATYPLDDLEAEATEQGWRFSHKDGSPY